MVVIPFAALSISRSRGTKSFRVFPQFDSVAKLEVTTILYICFKSTSILLLEYFYGPIQLCFKPQVPRLVVPFRQFF